MTQLTRRAMIGAIATCLVPKCLAAATPAIEQIFAETLTPDEALSRLMPAIVAAMNTDRCFIYMRDPRRRKTAFTHGYSRLPDWRSFNGGAWGDEPNPETLSEPMLKKAFSDPTPLFIEDIETAPPGTLNVGLERGFFGHRALVHAPIYHKGIFYGVLETAVRDAPRTWTQEDRDLIKSLRPRTAKLAFAYLGHDDPS